jgi:anthranilate synthase component 1
MHPSRAEFRAFAAQGNLVPVWREVLLDCDTPVSAYLKIQGERGGFLLESVEGGERWAAYSFLAPAPRTLLRVRGKTLFVERDGGVIQETRGDDPLTLVRDLVLSRKPAGIQGLPRFFGGAVGYLGYDMVRHWERLPCTAPDALGLPDALFWLTDSLVVFDNLKHEARVLALAVVDRDVDRAYDEACARIEALLERLRRPAIAATGAHAQGPLEVRTDHTREEFERSVERAKEYVRAGDIIQVVLSQRFEARAPGADPFDVYRALRTLNPSPYMFYLCFPEVALAGASPEVLVRVEGRTVETRPIAGTRPRGTTPEEDRRLEQELCADPKERAEHIMLLDLGRNDLGRVCQAGTLAVPERMIVERYSHVMHLVSGVRGTLAPGRDGFDALRAAFPAGTLSGAPKVRAMEIIEEMERSRRGPYGGAVGYLGYGGNVDLCIAIRTLFALGERFIVQAGAGIVADSDPAAEYQETVNKARAVLKAIEMAREGL